MKCFKDVPIYIEGTGIQRSDMSFGETIAGFYAEGEVIPLPSNAIVFPGFLDEHIHGAGGSDAMDGTQSALQTIAKTVAAEGTTGFLATTMTQSVEKIESALSAVREYRSTEQSDGAELLGVHLEGPYICSQYKGAQAEADICRPDPVQFDRYDRLSGGAIRLITLAPETEGAEELIRHIAQKGIAVSIGHTAAGYEDIVRAVEAGAVNVTHTYNAQSPLHHREIGTVGSALFMDSLMCELICDTIHVSVPAMKLLVKCKPEGKLTLVTDAIRAKGLQEGESELGGQKVFVKNGEARLENGTLAGSVLKMNDAIKNLVTKVKVPLLKAIDAATINPARTLKVDHERGSIRIGKRADFAVLNEQFDVLYTVRGGKIIYRRES